jgi:hypothetical protein
MMRAVNIVRSISAAVAVLAAARPAPAAETVRFVPDTFEQDVGLTFTFNGLGRVEFRSDLGIGEVTYGGGFVVDCGRPRPDLPPSDPTPLISSSVRVDPVFPLAVFFNNFSLGQSFISIPDYDAMVEGVRRTCRVTYSAGAEFSSFPLSIELRLGRITILAVGQEVNLKSSGFLDFDVIKPVRTGGGGGITPDNPDACPEFVLADQQCDPLLLDLGQDGIDLGPKGVGVLFDIDADGILEYSQWVRQGGNEAFLVLDRNGNGIVDGGAELFGNGTDLVLEGRRAPNGFVALAQFDDISIGGNDDGYITRDDVIWNGLALWLDSNADGISTPDEMLSLEDVGLVALPTIPKRKSRYDEAGNFIPFTASALTGSTPRKMEMIDVFFAAP